MTVHEWLLTMPEDLATEAVLKTPPSMLKERSSCLSEALAKAFIWREDKWERIYKDNMPNFALLLMEHREYFNISAFARASGINRSKIEDYLRDDTKHTPEFNEKLLPCFSAIAISMGECMGKPYRECQENPESQGL